MKKIFTLIAALFAVVAVNAQTEVTINFNELDHAMSWAKSDTEEASNAGDILTAEEISKDGVTVVISPAEEGNKNPNRFWRTNNGPQLRCYSGTITVKAEQDITGIEFNINASKFNLTPSVGAIGSGKWSGTAKEIVFTVGGNTQLNGLVVTIGGEPQPIVSIANTPETAYTVAKAHEIIDAGEDLGTKVYVKGIVSKIDEISIFVEGDETKKYGNATYYISDNGQEDGQLEVCRGYGLNGEKFTSEDQLKVGDELIVYGNLVAYGENKVHEFTQGSQIYYTTNAAGIENVTAKAANNGRTYNLAGQEVGKNFKGIVVKNGKKFMTK